MAEGFAQLRPHGNLVRSALARPNLAGAITSALLLITVLGGCVPPGGTRPPEPKAPVPASRPAPPPAPAPTPAPAPEPPVIPPPVTPSAPVRVIPPVSPASQALLNESRSHAAAGRNAQAAASIERALRIEPRHPLLWLELGNLRLREGDYAQAESLGRKALSLSAGDAAISARAQQLVSAAKNR